MYVRACVSARAHGCRGGLPQYFYCDCAAETVKLLSYKSKTRKAYNSYLTPGAEARSVAYGGGGGGGSGVRSTIHMQDILHMND